MTGRTAVVGESEAGFYAKKQLFSRAKVIAWSHRQRFERALALAAERPGGALLDYGCGDGTFVGLARPLFQTLVGADIAEESIADCQRRYPDVRFLRQAHLESPEHAASFDLVTCMEVLEHCVPASRQHILRELNRLCAPQGRIVISVPIEMGPSLLAKEALRSAAAWRGIGDYRYKERYRVGELVRMVLGGEEASVERTWITLPDGSHAFGGHKGFNWRAFRREIEGVLDVERTLFSPFGRVGEWFGSQAWFVCRPRPS